MEAVLKEIGSTGLNEYGGIIQEDFLREWRGIEAYKRANEMRLNSPVVAALLGAIEQSIRRVQWQLTSDLGDTDPRLELWQAQVDHLRGGWSGFVMESLTCLPFGYALFEIVWQRLESYVIAGKLAPRGQDTVYRWQFDDNGELMGVVQMAAPRYTMVEIPIDKLLHLKTRAERGNPEGRSILRTAWIPYYYAKNISQIEAIGIERDLAGLPVVNLPEGANTDTSDPNSDAAKAAKLVRNIRQDEQAGVVLPSGWELTLLSTGGSRQFDTDKIITRYESRILMTALAQFLMLGQQSVGSFSLSRDQTDLFVMSVNATADIIEAAISDQLLPRLMAVNGWTADGLKLTHSPAGDKDVTALVEVLSKMSGLITWMPEDELWLRELADMPAVDIEVIKAERERKAAQAQAIFERAAQPQSRENVEDEELDEVEEEEDDANLSANAEAVEFFKSERPDEFKRRRYERGMQRNLSSWFDKLKPRILKQARKERNGNG
jgi:hypothetical protein